MIRGSIAPNTIKYTHSSWVYTEFQKTLQRTQKPKEVLPDFSCCIPIALKEISLFFRRVFFFFIMHRYRSTQKYLIEYTKYTKNPPRPTGDFFLKLWTFDVSIQEHRQYTELFRKFKKIHTSSHFLHEYTSKNTIKKYDHIPLTQYTSRGILWNFREDKLFFEFQKYHSLDQSLQRRHEYSREIST